MNRLYIDTLEQLDPHATISNSEAAALSGLEKTRISVLIGNGRIATKEVIGKAVDQILVGDFLDYCKWHNHKLKLRDARRVRSKNREGVKTRKRLRAGTTTEGIPVIGVFAHAVKHIPEWFQKMPDGITTINELRIWSSKQAKKAKTNTQALQAVAFRELLEVL